jgi:separase
MLANVSHDNQERDTLLTRRISGLIQGSSQSSGSSGSRSDTSVDRPDAAQPVVRTSNFQSKSSYKQEASRISAVLTEATSILEDIVGSCKLYHLFIFHEQAHSFAAANETIKQRLPATLSALDDSKQFLLVLYTPNENSDTDRQRYADKVRRAIERLRRAAVKALEAVGNESRSSRQAIQVVVEKGVNNLESTVHMVC